ncbi:YceI family protein [Christiangramia aquimixticola]|uniref:YceI family protein n=1 Tax=Christiangramia aquimixticola TaxID=1697558 RepID=UPI003AA995AA
MRVRIAFKVIVVMLITMVEMKAQTFDLQKEDISLTVDGTSNIHDWQLQAVNISGVIDVEFSDENFGKITRLEVTVPSEGLKSGKKSMDKNIYKALHTTQYPEICFRLKSVKKFEKVSANNYHILLEGFLKIAGTERLIQVPVNLTQDKNNHNISGELALNMTDYKIEPPSALFGTIKTGDRVVVKFELSSKK